MNAAEARKLSDDAMSVKNGVVADIVTYALKMIEDTAKAGYRSTEKACDGLRNGANNYQITAAYKHLESLGFKVESNSDPRDGTSWTTVSW